MDNVFLYDKDNITSLAVPNNEGRSIYLQIFSSDD